MERTMRDELSNSPPSESPSDTVTAPSLCRPITPEYAAQFAGMDRDNVEELLGVGVDELLKADGPALNAFARQYPLEVQLLFGAHKLAVDPWLPPDVTIQYLAFLINADPAPYLDLPHYEGLALLRERAAPVLEIYEDLPQEDMGVVFSRVMLSENLADAPALIRELKAFLVTISGRGHAKFEGKSEHDDLVIAVALAVWWRSRAES